MLVKQLEVFMDSSYPQPGAGDHANALSPGLRPPLQLTSLSIRHPWPLKPLQKVDAQQLTALTVISFLDSASSAVRSLATELGRFSQLQELHCSLLGTIDNPLNFGSSFAQLTALRRLTLGDWCSSADWQQVSSQLQYLNCCWLGDEAFSNLLHLVQLQELFLRWPEATGSGLAAAASCMPQLQVLAIANLDRNQASMAGLLQLQAFQAMSSLQRLELLELDHLTSDDITCIAQASRLISLKLEFCGVYDPDIMELDLSGFTTLQQLHDLDVCHSRHLDAFAKAVSVATFGHTLTHFPLLRVLAVSVALHDLALVQVLSCTQLTTLKLSCLEYKTSFGHPNSNNAMYHVPGCLQLNSIALHMTQLQLLRIWACPQDKLVAVLNGPWLPHLKQLELYTHQKHAPLEPEEVEALLAAIHQARPALQASFTE